MRPLTEPEFRLMCHLSAGRSRQEIAKGLGISYSTLVDRITAVRIKLDAQTNATALAAFKRVYEKL